MKEDLERPVNKFINIVLGIFVVLPLLAQTNNEVSVVDSLATEQVSMPVIEYTMQRKTYEIAGITVSGAESYEDFVLVGFSGLALIIHNSFFALVMAT